MDRHPIESIMTTTMENIRDMVDVNTVVGEAIATSDGSTVIPISKVSFGFVAGGGEYDHSRRAQPEAELPFAGGTGAGVSIHPMGFLVVNAGQVRLIPSQHNAPVDKIIEMVPQVMTEIKNVLASCSQKKQAEAAQAAQPAQPAQPTQPEAPQA